MNHIADAGASQITMTARSLFETFFERRRADAERLISNDFTFYEPLRRRHRPHRVLHALLAERRSLPRLSNRTDGRGCRWGLRQVLLPVEGWSSLQNTEYLAVRDGQSRKGRRIFWTYLARRKVCQSTGTSRLARSAFGGAEPRNRVPLEPGLDDFVDCQWKARRRTWKAQCSQRDVGVCHSFMLMRTQLNVTELPK